MHDIYMLEKVLPSNEIYVNLLETMQEISKEDL